MSQENEDRAKRHMLADRKSFGQVPSEVSKERIDKFYPEFWETGKLTPSLKVVK